ncbi:MAG: response regulator [Lachnospiraceae bacterium]|nr:response regulator [Lachnospiraceae bacterium]
MDNKGRFYNDNDNLSELVMLSSYTLLTVILSGEATLLSWELWVIPLLYIGIISAWIIYLVRAFELKARLWIYGILMMLAMFYYGIHLTSAFDLAPIMGVVMMIFAIVDIPGIIYMAMANYYLIMLYNLLQILAMHVKFDSLGVTRALLHLLLVFMFGKLALVFLNRNKKERELYDEIINDLEETNRRTEDFLTNVSHEFRTPINAVTGVTSVLMNKVKDKEILDDVLAIQTAGYRLLEQVGDILDYTEIDTGHFTLSEDVYMITSIVNDIVTEKRVSLDRDERELVINVEPDIPAQMYGDGSAIKKIIRNLIDNAYKFTKEGGVYVHIYTIKKPYGVNLCIEVTDTGIGIDDAELKRIKEKFYQVNSSRSRRAGGLGLGLSVVYGLTKVMDGFVKIDSVKSEGTTVHVSIPQRVSDSSPSVTIDEKEEYCIGYFLDFDKYVTPKIREFYQHAIYSMVKDFGVVLYNVGTIDEVKDLIRKYKLTHLFVGSDEYINNKDVIDNMSDEFRVVVFKKPGSNVDINMHLKSIKMPFYSFSIAQALTMNEYDEDIIGKRMICNNVTSLVVDDEPMNLMVAKGIFKNYGMKVKTVLSGMEALDICEKERFDIIFMDHMMPDMDGIETLKRLRNMESSLGYNFTVVALTANAVSGAKEMFLSEGFDGFVAKPIDQIELERVMRKVLGDDKVSYEDKEPIDEGSSASDDVTELTEVKELSKANKPKDMLDQLREAGIDVDTGMKYCGSSKDFYITILTKYVEESKEKLELLEKYYEAKDYENYKIHVHAVKSTSKMIGVNDIYDEALQLENAAKNEDASYIEENHETLIMHYQDKIKLISEAI